MQQEIERIVEKLEASNVNLYDIDDLIYDLAEEEGWDVAERRPRESVRNIVDATLNKVDELNYHGLTGQIQYLVKTCGLGGAKRLLSRHFGIAL